MTDELERLLPEEDGQEEPCAEFFWETAEQCGRRREENEIGAQRLPSNGTLPHAAQPIQIEGRTAVFPSQGGMERLSRAPWAALTAWRKKGTAGSVPRRDGVAAEGGAPWAETAPPLSGGVKPTAAVTAWSRTGASAAGRLYGQMGQVRQAAGYQRPAGRGRRPLSKPETELRSAAVEATVLDRVFQRDARRYDGGFTWQ